MAVLKAKQRRGLRSSQFALPSQRKYPIHDKPHAVNAKARSTQMYRRGKLSKSQMQTVHRKANKVLGLRGMRAMM